MKKIETSFDPELIEAEENLLIDCQFLLQELMVEKGISRTELANKANISKARLSQILSPEANPTLKTIARVFHALGEALSVSPRDLSSEPTAAITQRISVEDCDWRWTEPTEIAVRIDEAKLVAVVKESLTSNDNYRRQVVVMESGKAISLEAA